MKDAGIGDRIVANRLTEAGLKIAATAVFKTRRGTRNPAIDECLMTAHLFGYSNLEDFLAGGPSTRRLKRAAGSITSTLESEGKAYRDQVQAALQELRDTLRDPEVVQVAEASDENWRNTYRDRLLHELFGSGREQLVLWMETVRSAKNVFDEAPEPNPNLVVLLQEEWRAAGLID